MVVERSRGADPQGLCAHFIRAGRARWKEIAGKCDGDGREQLHGIKNASSSARVLNCSLCNWLRRNKPSQCLMPTNPSHAI